MKRVVSSSIITLFILIVVAASYLYFRNFKNVSDNPVIAIPADFSFFIIYDPAEQSLTDIASTDIWKKLNNAPFVQQVRKAFEHIQTFSASNASFDKLYNSGPLVISAHVTSANSFDFLYLHTIPSEMNEHLLDQMITDLADKEAKVTKRNYDGTTIREVSLPDGKIYTYTFLKGIFISSFTTFIVEDAIRQLKVGQRNTDDFIKIADNIESTGLDIYIQYSKISSFTGIFTDNEKVNGIDKLKYNTRFSGGGIKISDNVLSIKGLLFAPDSTLFQFCFNSQEPVEMNLLSILPSKSAVIDWYGLSDFNAFYNVYSQNYFLPEVQKRKSNLKDRIQKQFQIDIESELLKMVDNEFAFVITEPSGMKYDNNCYAVFKVKDGLTAVKTLRGWATQIDKKGEYETMQEVYGDYNIGLVRLKGVLPAIFGEMFNRVHGMFFTSIDNYVVFANQASSLRTFIDDYEKKSLLIKSKQFSAVKKNIPKIGNHFFMVKPSASFYIFKSAANAQWRNYADKYRDVISDVSSIAYLQSAGKPFNWFNTVMLFNEGDNEQGITSSFSIDTDSSVTMPVLITTDPNSNTRQILFQDNADVLYLCDNSGNTLWRKQLTGRVMGRIHEIDLFKNNSRQFLFNTRDYMYLIDINGNPVGNYPIRLPAAATTGLSALTFDDAKGVRLYVACENKAVYAYLPSGKPLPGWVFRELTGKVINEIKKVNIGGRFYLFIADDLGNIFITKNFGETGIKITDRIIVGKNTSFFNDASGNLIFTDYRGNIVSINSTGNVDVIPLNAADDGHGFLFTDVDNDLEPEYLFLNRSELVVYNQNLVMLYRKEFEQILSGGLDLFELGSGSKVMTIRSEYSNQFWLLNMNGDPLEGFPLKGSGIPVLDELNLDGNKNLFIGGQDNRLHVYSLKNITSSAVTE